MPRTRTRFLLSLLFATACSPAAFVWNGEPDTGLVPYLAAFADAAGTGFDYTMDRRELIARLRGERVLWLGDHHRSSRLHALQMQLLADLQASGFRMVLLLEAIGLEDEAAVQEYLDGVSSMAALRQRMRTRWRGSWLDDRDLDPWHYRSLLAFARRHQVPVQAIEPAPRPPIHERDERIAARVRSAAEACPDRLLVVHVGQAHLVGAGALVARTGLGGLALGGEPPPALRSARAPTDARHTLVRSDGDLWWFAEMLGGDD